MTAGDQDPMDQVFAISQSCDATQLKLTAAEGFLLSRIDGTTPWRHLREMGGIPAEEVDACLSQWLEDTVISVVGGSTKRSPETSKTKATTATSEVDAASVPPEPCAPILIDESALNEDLDISLAVQTRILEYEASLARPYHELLDVKRGAEPKVVKRAYFKLSKEFHPDRYFRREIGTYGARLDRIFKKILEAHEMLSDPELCQVENHAAAEPVKPPQTASVDAAAVPETIETPATSAKPRELTKLERLRQRMPFKIDHAGIAARRAKADEIFKAACNSQQSGRLGEAEASIRIAISFDPRRAEFKEALGSLRLQAAGDHAAKLLAKPNERMSETDMREVMTLIEDVLIYRPHDPELNERAARICLKLSRLDHAKEYAETLIERCPDVAAHHALLGLIFRGQENLDAAMSEFETALKIDENNLDARRALAAMRIGHHDAVQGGGS